MNDPIETNGDGSSAIPIEGPGSPGKSARGVLCVKCEHLNPLAVENCEICDGHLYIKCNECGAKNPRVGARCVECQRRLHKPRRGSRGNRPVLSRGWSFGIMLGIIFAIVLVLVYFGDSLGIRLR